MPHLAPVCASHDFTGQGATAQDVPCTAAATARVTIDDLAGYLDRPVCDRHLERTRRMHRRHYPTLVLTVAPSIGATARPAALPDTPLDQA